MELKVWKASIEDMYQARGHHVYIVPEGSFAARGNIKVGRTIIERVTSPRGGRYLVFDTKTAAQKAESMRKEAEFAEQHPYES